MTDVGTKNYQNQAIRITDLTVVRPMLDGYRFSNCSIHGPAILVPLDRVTISDCGWDAPTGFNGLFWEIEEGREFIVGAIGLVDTSFVGCSFQGIGLAGTADRKAEMAKGFGE